jgi:hypothetical protein
VEHTVKRMNIEQGRIYCEKEEQGGTYCEKDEH